jgi:anti-sigma-K factor RskA
MMSNDPDIHTLTGAYALNALPDDEREAFEEHLDACDACAAETAEFLATAARLGGLLHEPAPADLKVSVLAEVDRTRQDRPTSAGAEVVDLAARRAAPPAWVTWVTASAAAVAALAVVVMGVQLGSVNDRLEQAESIASQAIEQLDDVEGRSARVEQLLAAPDIQTISYQQDGVQGQLVVSDARGEAVFIASGLDPAPHEHTYELWVIGDDGAVPAGLFDVDNGATVTQIVEGDFAGAAALGVTVEPAGGSPQPTTDPVMVMELSS